MKTNRYELPVLPVWGDRSAAAIDTACNALRAGLIVDRRRVESSKDQAAEIGLKKVVELRIEEVKSIDDFLLQLEVERHTAKAVASRRGAETSRMEAEKAKPAVDAAQKELDALRPKWEEAEAALKDARRGYDWQINRAESQERAATEADRAAITAKDAIDHPNGRPRLRNAIRRVVRERSLEQELALLPAL